MTTVMRAAVQVVRRLQRRRADVDHHRLAVLDERRRRGADPVLRLEALDDGLLERRLGALTAPPRTRSSFPSRASSRRSRRTVISDTPKLCARSLTCAGPDWTARSIAWRRCVGSLVPHLRSRRSNACTSLPGVSNETSAEPSRAQPVVGGRVDRDADGLAAAGDLRALVPDDMPAHVGRPRRRRPVGQRAGREPVVGRRIVRRRAARDPDRDVALLARPEEEARPPGSARAHVERRPRRGRARRARSGSGRRAAPAGGRRSARRCARTVRSSAASRPR